MGNYRNLEYDFIERTLALIAQYEATYHKYKFEEQYNHTLLINCLLGVIVMPKERILKSIPKSKITPQLKKDMGINHSGINVDISEFKDFVIQLRHSIAHFNIEVKSNDDVQFLIDKILFLNPGKGKDYVVATFEKDELLPFVRYYASWIMSNMKSNPVDGKPVRAKKPLGKHSKR